MLKSIAFRAIGVMDRLLRGDPEAGRKSFSDLNRFLFLHYEKPLGSAVNSTPLFAALRAAIPHAYVAVACSGVTHEVLKYSPYIDRVIETPDGATWTLQVAKTIRQSLREAPCKIQCVVTNSWNSTPRIALLNVLAGSFVRLGYAPGPGLYHESLEYDNEISVIENNLRLLSILGHESRPLEPQVFFSARELEQAERLLAQSRPNDGKRTVLFATQGSGGQPSAWYRDRWIQVGDQVAGALGGRVLFVGTAKDEKEVQAIRGGMRAASVSLVGRTDIPTLAALCCLCDLGVTLDTGTMHVARSVQLPLVIVAPAWQPAREWLPLGHERFVIVRRDEIACRHCRDSACAARECMATISASEVITAVEQLLQRYPPSLDARQARLQGRLVDTAS